MSDVAGAAAPAAGADAGPGPMPAMESLRDAAANRFEALQADKAFGARVLAKDAAAVNERQTLMKIIAGGFDDASVAVLASSIELKPKPSLTLAERQSADAKAAAEARAPAFGHQDRTDFDRRGLQNVTDELGAWTKEIGLPTSIAKTVVQAVVDSGVRKMDAQAYASWKERQDALLLGAAHGDHDQVKSWRDAAAKVLARGKFNFENSAALNSAFAIRALALASTLK